VVAADLDARHAEATAAAVRDAGSKALALTFDILDRASIDKMVDDTLAQMGRLDILVNSVGISRMAHAEDITQEDWDTVLGVFLSGLFWTCQSVAKKAMIPHKYGKIINIASMSGMVVTGDRGSNYAAAKAAVIQLSRALGTEWAKYGIYVNAISPGTMRTALTEPFLKDPEMYRQSVNAIPLRRVGEPADLAGSVVFLASSASDYILGHNLVVDGGYTAI
jgi:NAD(P)-dependent dehydrogenase (short-subunit alcohol dehydrogenase family)